LLSIVRDVWSAKREDVIMFIHSTQRKRGRERKKREKKGDPPLLLFSLVSLFVCNDDVIVKPIQQVTG
jgi:hypothetical protein